MLTDKQVRNAKPEAKQRTLVDADGLELLITPAGAKIWRFRYRFAGERRRITLGRYPDLGLASARAAASRLRTQLWAGEDPGASVVVEVPRAELGGLVDRYLAEHAPSWKPSTARTYASALASFRAWTAETGLVRANQLDAAALASLRAWLIQRPRRAKARGGSRRDVSTTGERRSAAAVNCELRAIKTMLQALRRAELLPALGRDAITDNLRLLELEQHRPDPLKPAQLRALLGACRRHDSNAEARASPLVLLMLLSGMRLGEALRLRWVDVDLDDLALRVVAGKTKHERLVDLSVSPALVQLLERERARAESPFVVQHTQATALAARLRLIEAGAPAFLWSTRHSRPGERSAPTLRSTCGCYLTCAPGIFGGASIYRSAAQLGHSVAVAERHYLGALRRLPADATTIEAAMGIADLLGGG